MVLCAYILTLAIANTVIAHRNLNITHNAFPYHEVFGTFNQSLEGITMESYLCEEPTSACCECSRDCFKRRSCCINSAWNTHNSTLSAYLDWFVANASAYMHLECMSPFHGVNFMDSTNYMMIQSCPQEQNSKKEVKCKTGNFLPPVLGSNGDIYKNQFCAECNSVTDYILLDVIMVCNITRDDFINQNIKVYYENCTVRFDQNADSVLWDRRIFPCKYPTKYGRECPKSNPYYKLCNSYLAYSNGFTNPHCMICANYTATSSVSNKHVSSNECPVNSNVNAILPEWKFDYAMRMPFRESGCSPDNNLNQDLKYCTTFRCSITNKDYACDAPATTFPYHEFFNTSGYSVGASKMQSYVQCKGKLRSCCDCTKDCASRRSCCIHSEWTHHKGTLSEYIELVIKRASPYIHLECKPLLSGITFFDVKSYMMIASCSQEASVGKKVKCQKDGFLFPVLAADGKMYKNGFCAKCNNARDYKTLGVTMTCNTTRDNFIEQNLIFNYENCTVRVDHTSEMLLLEKGISPCKYPANYKRECHPSNPYYKLCNSYLAYSHGFANPHCMKCANYTVKSNDTNECPLASKHDVNRPEMLFNYAMMISFGPTGCSPGSDWDGNLKHCTSFECSNQLIEKDNACTTSLTEMTFPDTITKPSGDSSSIDVPISNQIIKTKNSDQFTKCLLKSGEIGLIATCPRYEDPEAKGSLSDGNNCTMESDFDLNRMEGDRPHYEYVGERSILFFQKLLRSCFRKQWLKAHSCKFVEASSVKKQNTNFLDYDFQHNFPKGEICFNISKIPIRHIRFDEHCSFSHAGKTYKYGHYLLVMRFTNKEKPLKHVIVCNKYHLRKNCQMKELDLEVLDLEYYVDPQRNLVASKSKRSYPPDAYVPFKNGIRVCVDVNKPLPTGTQIVLTAEVQLAKYYITVCGLPLSMVSYILVIMVHGFVRELRNKTAFDLICLCISLSVSDAIMMTLAMGYIDKEAFKHVAVALHWCFLNSLSWITVMSVELLYFLHHEYIIIQHNILRRCFKSWILATLAPSLIIFVMIFLNHYHPTWVGYGQTLTNRLMSNKTAIYVTLIAPFVVTNVLSLAISIAVAIKLHLHKISTNLSGITRSNGQININVAKAAMKLVAVFGGAEIFGVIQTNHATMNDVFSTLYVFLRSTRGIFIFLLYLCNVKVRKLLQNEIQTRTSSA